MRSRYGRLQRSPSPLRKRYPQDSETGRTGPTFSWRLLEGCTSLRSWTTSSRLTSRKAGHPRNQLSWRLWLVWHYFLLSPHPCEDPELCPKPAQHLKRCVVRKVCKVCKRFGDIRYNGTLDTCAYFDFREMASRLLSRNGFSCLFNCRESTILLTCVSRHFVSATRLCAR